MPRRWRRVLLGDALCSWCDGDVGVSGGQDWDLAEEVALLESDGGEDGCVGGTEEGNMLVVQGMLRYNT